MRLADAGVAVYAAQPRYWFNQPPKAIRVPFLAANGLCSTHQGPADEGTRLSRRCLCRSRRDWWGIEMGRYGNSRSSVRQTTSPTSCRGLPADRGRRGPNVRRADATSNSSGASSSAKLVSSPEPPVSPFVARHQLDRRYCEFAKDDAAIPDFLSPSECRSNPSIFYCVSASRQGRLEDGCFDTMAHCYARSGEFVSMHFDILERCDRIVVEKATPR